MAKAKPTKPSGSEARAPPPLPNRDVFHRINFAYQSAAFLHQLGAAGPSSSGQSSSTAATAPQGNSGSKKRKWKADRKSAADGQEGVGKSAKGAASVDWSKLARKGTKEMKRMAVHTQVKIDPSVKRAICKTCSTVLIPGLTCKVRNRPSKSHTHITHYTCLACETIRSIPNPPLTLPASPATTVPGATSKPKKRRPNKVAFHEREHVLPSGGEAGVAPAAPGAEKGHGLWRGDKALSGWGANPLPPIEPETTV